MTANTDVHTCSYYCERPGCIRAQRDELAARLTAETSNARGYVLGLVALAEQMEREAAGCRRDGYIGEAVVLENYAQRIRRTLGISAIAEALAAEGVQAEPNAEALGGGEAEPQNAPVWVDFAAVASILRRAMRDGVHYGYRRDFILQQALALEAISQQPAAVDGLAVLLTLPNWSA